MATAWPEVRTADEKMAAKRNDIPVKIDAEVVAEARIAAATKGLSLAEYVSETLRPLVKKDIADYAQRVQTPPKPKGSK